MSELMLGIVLLVVYLICMLIVVQIKKDNSIGNFTWGGGVLLITLYTFLIGHHSSRSVLITAIICLWALRLIIYLYSRYKKGADPRFIEWQKQWGRYALLISFWWIFIMNGTMAIIMSLPSILINRSLVPNLNVLDVIGLLIWLIGFCCESIADFQLHNFMKNPANKGKIMMQGLWRYSRHPNYFGEITMWWGIYLIALSVPYGWITIIAPLTITILLIFFTGVPMLERVFKDNPEYQEYKKHTSMLIPWFNKK
jgi:steroid 5-alpha reductase family enzyme